MEEALFKNLPKGEKALLLWRNGPSVVMGRFQNPWVECHLPMMAKQGVALARRQSGGGTVFHDAGNINISFLDWNENYDKELNNRALVRGLKTLGHTARTSGRSDVQIETDAGPRKVSGAAFKQKRERSFHHCTMLLESDLDSLNAHLRSSLSSEKVQSKAISSVRSKVANIKTSKAKFYKALVDAWEDEAKRPADIVYWDKDQCASYVRDHASAYLKKLKSWEWIFGETPLFRTEFESGEWKALLAVKKGIIKEFDVENEGIHPSFLSSLQELMEGATFRLSEIQERVKLITGLDVYKKEVDGFLKDLERAFGLGFKI